MGIDSNNSKALLYARKNGASFDKCAMIGRQMLNVNAPNLYKNLRQFGFDINEESAAKLLTSSNGYAEDFLRLLGAREIASFDASNYENATDVHDFNLPIAERCKNRFSLVFDGGTLEHIFNFPTAIRNCMEMVETGGHFLSVTPANNFFGHGFYQFSAELFFRIFNKTNGFAQPKIILFEDFVESDWFEVTDPETVKERVTLTNNQPTSIMIFARKTAVVPIFAQTPQQADYSMMWQNFEQNGKESDNKLVWQQVRPMLKKPLDAARLARKKIEQARGALSSKTRFFKKIDLP